LTQTEQKPTILVVEDEPTLVDTLEYNLTHQGYAVSTATDGFQALELARSLRPDLIVLDVMLPGRDGLDICRSLRASNNPALAGLYIIMLTARVEETDRVVGLELSADDYVTKPFSPRELVARVRSVLRRQESHLQSADSQVLRAGPLRLDPVYRTVSLEEEPIELTATEFELLHHFLPHPGRPFTRAELLDVTQGDAIGDVSAYERTGDITLRLIADEQLLLVWGDAQRLGQVVGNLLGNALRIHPPEAR